MTQTSPEQSFADLEFIEGLDLDEDRSWVDYPIDTVLIRNENRTVHDVLRRIEQGSFIMDPEFQRDFIWPEDKQSKLIESVLMRIPLPVFYLAEDPQGRMIVVDGLQRLSTFQRFVNNELRLRLPNQSDMNRKTFSALSAKLQNRIEDCNLILYVIDAKAPERVRLDIFDRVNSGLPLTRQQMRNCLFTGQATHFLREESRTALFLDATGRSLNARTMRDREFINRFCAFVLVPLDDYSGDMDDFLAEALEAMNRLESEQLELLRALLRDGLANNLLVFGRHAFRKHSESQTSRNVINAALWDVMSTGLARYSPERVEQQSRNLRSAFYDLLEDAAFSEAITIGTNDTRRIRNRFAAVDSMLKSVFGD
jgi:hypothetical protein